MDREVGPGRGVFLSRYDHAKHLENKVITVICGYPIEKSCGFFLSFALLSFSLYRVLPEKVASEFATKKSGERILDRVIAFYRPNLGRIIFGVYRKC